MNRDSRILYPLAMTSPDINKQKKHCNAVKPSSVSLKTRRSASSESISDGLILEANQRFANLYGFDSPEEMIG